MTPKYDTEPDESTLDRARLPDEITDESGRKWVHFGYGWDADTGIISDRVYTTAPSKEQHNRSIHKLRVLGPDGLGTWKIPEGAHHLDSYPEHNITQTAPCKWPFQ